MNKMTGRCQCGEITYETERPVAAWICHCRDCQRMTGGAYSFSMAVPRAGFRFAQGEPRRFLKTGDNGVQTEQLFCAACSTWLASLSPAAPQAVILRVGTLDDHRWITPGSQVWTDSALPWAVLPDVPQVRRDPTPEQIAEVMATWMARHYPA